MFCNQCEQTAKGIGCNIAGVCGKNEEVADLQDLLIHALQGLALFAQEGRKKGIIDDATDLFALEAIFSTLTNVDFDPDRFVVLINKTVELREAMKAKVAAAGGKTDFTEAPANGRRHQLIGITGESCRLDTHLYPLLLSTKHR